MPKRRGANHRRRKKNAECNDFFNRPTDDPYSTAGAGGHPCGSAGDSDGIGATDDPYRDDAATGDDDTKDDDVDVTDDGMQSHGVGVVSDNDMQTPDDAGADTTNYMQSLGGKLLEDKQRRKAAKKSKRSAGGGATSSSTAAASSSNGNSDSVADIASLAARKKTMLQQVRKLKNELRYADKQLLQL